MMGDQANDYGGDGTDRMKYQTWEGGELVGLLPSSCCFQL